MRRVVAALALMALWASRAQGGYEEGLEARQAGDFAGAMNEWMTASDDPRCMTAIAGMFDRGEGVSQDVSQAVEWYQRAADGGDYRAMAQLANYSLQGVAAEGRARTPIEWRAELEQNRGRDPYVDYVLAYFYANAYGGERRLHESLNLLQPIANRGYAPFTAFYNEVKQRLDDIHDGVLEAEALAREMAKGEVSFDARWRDKRITVSGYVNTVNRLRDYGYVMKFGGPNVSVIPKDNLLAVFYAPLVTDPLSALKRGDYVKIDGVYVGRHPFELEPGALTLFGCNLLKVVSGDSGR